MTEPMAKEPKIGKTALSAELAERVLGFLEDVQGRFELPLDVSTGAAELWAWMDEELREGGVQ